jgi:hypothetical protein
MDYLALQADFLRKAEPIVDSYKGRLDKVERVLKSEKNSRLGFSDFDKAYLAIMYDNVDKELNRYRRMKNLSDRTYSEQTGPFIRHAYNIITALYTTLELRDLVSIQPLTQKRGAIYKMIYQFASNKGAVRAGDTMFAPGQSSVRARHYSGQLVDGEPVTWTFDTNSLATLEYFPISKPEKIKIVVTGGAAAGTYTYLSADNGIYNLKKDAGTTTAGTLDPSTGVVTLTAVDASGATGTVATYNWQSEKFSQGAPIPKVTVSVTESEVTAERRNLLIDTMLDVSYDFETQFAQSLNSELEATVIQYMQNELSFRVLGDLYDGANGNGGSSYVFNTIPAGGHISLVEHAQNLYKLLAEMSAKVRTNVGRGWGNKIIAGDDLINFLRVLPQNVFERAERPKADGPYFVGVLNGDYDVYYNPDYPAGEFLMTYKGESWWEAPYYIGSYLPLMNSQYLLYPDMHGEQGYISMEAFSYEYPAMVVKGSVTAVAS